MLTDITPLPPYTGITETEWARLHVPLDIHDVSKKQPLWLFCITLRNINRFEWKFQPIQLRECWIYGLKISGLFVKYSFSAAFHLRAFTQWSTVVESRCCNSTFANVLFTSLTRRVLQPQCRTKAKHGSGTYDAIWPGNGFGLFYGLRGLYTVTVISKSSTYMCAHHVHNRGTQYQTELNWTAILLLVCVSWTIIGQPRNRVFIGRV